MKTWSVVASLAVILLLSVVGISQAGVNVNLSIGLPVYTFAEEPELVVVPNTYVYFAPGIDIDIVFSHGYWYRPHNGYWYRSNSYNGPWHVIKRHLVPRYIINLPPDYRTVYRDYPRIPHRHVHDNWRRWERNKYWDKRQWKHDQNEWKHERYEHKRDARQERREDRREHRQDARQDRQEHRQDMRQDRRENRQDMQKDRQEHRQEMRKDRQEHRQDMRQDRREDRKDRRENKHDAKPERKDRDRDGK